MQSLNDDMDELFRKAGEEYPLNTNSDDWNKVLQGLNHAEAGLTEETKKKKDYRFLLLLLLLPLGFIIGRYNSTGSKATSGKANKQAKTIAVASGKTRLTGKIEAQAAIKAKEAYGNVAGTEKPAKIDIVNTAGNTITYSAFKTTKKSSGNIEVNKRSGSQTSLSATDAFLTAKSKETPAVINSGENITDGPITSSSAAKETALNTGDAAVNGDSSIVGNIDKKTPVQLVKNPAVESEKNIKKDSITIKRKLYYSLVVGPDISTVKFHNQSKVGYSLGLMLAYKINGQLSVEAGAMWDKKHYYANGSYLDTNKLGLPMHSIVSAVDGMCDMIEIPLNINYTLFKKKDHSWFVSTGLSSYFMKNESYILTYERYSMPFVRDYGYKNSARNWFSIINVSAGYQTSLGKNTNLSIAPYIKLPLKGIGIGKLPVTSTGIYISLSRPVW